MIFLFVLQIVGLTASLGAGKARETAEAEQHVLQLCANMDAEKVVTVTENMEELDKHVSSPQREIFPGAIIYINIFVSFECFIEVK